MERMFRSSYGISQAGSRIVQIVEWAILAATVGLILRMLEDRAGLAGQIALSLVGAAWSIATFFVVPIIVYEGLGPMASIKRSLGILRKSWGESFVGFSISFGIIFVLLGLAGLIPLLLAFAIGGTAVGLVVLVIVVAYWICLVIVGSAVHGVLVASLYRYEPIYRVRRTEDFPVQIFQGEKKNDNVYQVGH